MIMLYDEVCKESPRAEALKEIRRFTDKEEPQLIRLLARTVDDMQNVVTYKTIRDALLSGSISQSALSAIQLAYTNFVANSLVKIWDKAFQSAGRDMEKRRRGFVYNPSSASMDQWTQNRAADFVTNCTKETIAGVRAAVRHSVYHEALGVNELAQVIRPMVGLNLPQVKANQNYFNLLIKNGVSKKRATEMAQKYAERQHRYRAQMIARTESAMAYNHAQYEAVHQAISQGYMGAVRKVWCTADDERTCGECRSLDGQEIGLDEDFGFRSKLPKSHGMHRVPPAHPHCRCTVLYQEVSPPNKGD